MARLSRTERLQARLQQGQKDRYKPSKAANVRTSLNNPIARGRGMSIDKGTKHAKPRKVKS